MRSPGVTRLELDLRRAVEPISGHVRIAGREEQEFAGMLELMALLDDARAATPPDEEEPG